MHLEEEALVILLVREGKGRDLRNTILLEIRLKRASFVLHPNNTRPHTHENKIDASGVR